MAADASAGAAQDKAVDALSVAEAAEELRRLAGVLSEANTAYHTEDAPQISDAAYDALKRRNADIEARFPDLKREDSPSDRVGAEPSTTFSKVRHEVRMLSLGNAFDDDQAISFPGLRHSWGFGFRWFSPIGPLRFEWGLPSYINLMADYEHAFTRTASEGSRPS